MSDNTNLVPVNLEQLPSTQIGSDDQFADLAKSTDYLGRLQLFTKGKAVNRKLVGPGNYGIPESDEEVNDLGDNIDIIPLARRPKAIDMTDNEAIIVNYDPDSEEFKRIAAQSLEKEVALHVRPVVPRLRAEHRPLPGVLLRQQVQPQRGQEDLPLPAADAGGHRRQGGQGRRRERLAAARPAAADAEEPAGGEGHLLVARSGRREVRDGVHEFAADGADRQGDRAFLTVKDNGVERADGRRRRSRPLVVICSPPDLPQGPGGVS